LFHFASSLFSHFKNDWRSFFVARFQNDLRRTKTDEHFYTVLRYVERNALRANLVSCAEDWHWSSLWRRQFGNAESRQLLSAWPLPRPRDWLEFVNRPQSDAEMTALRRSVQRGTPFGSTQWQVRTAKRLGLEWTIRPRGRPRKQSIDE
jgi:putative transposase